jgi:sortase A
MKNIANNTQHVSKLKIYLSRLKQRKMLKQIGLDLGAGLILLSLLYMGLTGYEKIDHDNAQRDALNVAKKIVGMGNQTADSTGSNVTNPEQTTTQNKPSPGKTKVIGTLSIPKLKRTLPVVEGTSAKELRLGVGHMSETVLPGMGDQIIFSGHNDTVFKNFDKMKIGDRFIVNLSNGEYTYETRKTIIVDKNDTSIVRKMGEEVLVVTTCYPFRGPSPAPQRFVAYAYPVKK